MDYDLDNGEVVDTMSPPVKQKGKPNRYSKETKADVIRRVKEGESVSAIQKQTGISNVTIYGWMGRTKKYVPKKAKVKKRKYRNITKTMGVNKLKNPPAEQPTSIIQSLADVISEAVTKLAEAIHILERI